MVVCARKERDPIVLLVSTIYVRKIRDGFFEQVSLHRIHRFIHLVFLHTRMAVSVVGACGGVFLFPYVFAQHMAAEPGEPSVSEYKKQSNGTVFKHEDPIQPTKDVQFL
jgi:hypothetical protein